jgi:hypothetical protein
MPRQVAIVAALTLAGYPANRLSAQVALEISAGARYSTPLVHDSIVRPFSVRPALAPAVAVALGTPFQRGWAARVTVDVSTSEMRRHTVDGSTVSLGRVGTAAFTVGLARRLPMGFSARLGVGGLKYFPGDQSGVFRLGSGPIEALGALAIGHGLFAGGRYRLAIEARYDVHWFTTPALRNEGFLSGQPVHRLALVISTGRGGAR